MELWPTQKLLKLASAVVHFLDDNPIYETNAEDYIYKHYPALFQNLVRLSTPERGERKVEIENALVPFME